MAGWTFGWHHGGLANRKLGRPQKIMGQKGVAPVFSAVRDVDLG